MTGVIILAAGASTRLGQPKQKLAFKGKSLLQNAIDAAVTSCCTPVIVVLGANAENIEAGLENECIHIIVNAEWPEGMSSSIRKGIEELQKTTPQVSDVILMVCDQPFVSAEILHQLIETKAATGKKIVASSYNHTLGVPVLFDKIFFPELLLLKGQEGAKKLLDFHKESVAQIEFPGGDIDIDTRKDYEALQP